MKRCPACGCETVKVIYMGLPARLCCDEACSILFGFLSGVLALLPFNGWFFVYEGSYIKGLIDWFREW